MGARVQPNPALAAQLRAAPGLAEASLRAARRIAEEAQRIARAEAYDPDSTGPHYADEITGGVARSRAGIVGRVTAGKYTSSWIENGYTHVGGEHIAGRHILRRAAEAAGYRPAKSDG